MPDLPTGTVTFLFTDIEGSTQLLQRLGDRYITVLTEYQRLLRAAFEAWNGREVDTQGDAFFVAFSRATDAVEAAAAVQRALIAHVWPEGVAVRVRMGLHTGEPALTAGGYVGLDVVRAARLCAAGHGGQALLSQAMHALVEHHLPEGMGLRDLGEHRLKDLQQPARIFQLLIPNLPADFPSLRTLGSRPNNLPTQVTSLIGREWEIETTRQRLLRPDVRLLTLTGPGGAGKTRLALQIAADSLDDFESGAFFVSLAPLSDPGLVIPTIARTLGVKGAAGRSPTESLKDHLRNRSLLLVLDNFEHLIAAAPQVADLLTASPGLKALVTSRAALRVYGEYESPVPPLTLPDPQHLPFAEADLASILTRYEAVRLFIERAIAVKPDFAVTNDNAPAVAGICHRLDGLPLAIELAAARIRLLPPQAMLARLERRLPLLTGGARDLPARQQTLRNAIAWSYDLLEPDEQTLFRRLAVFVGGFTLEEAEALTPTPLPRVGEGRANEVSRGEGQPSIPDLLDGLDSLVSKSLLRQEEAGGQPRFIMLETIREYALERLTQNGEAEAMRRQHADCFLALAEEAEPELRGPQQAEWLIRLEEEHDNLRAALRWSIERGEAEQGLRLGGALWRFWEVRGHLTEGRERLTKVLALAGTSGRTGARAKALNGAGVLASRQGDYAAARAFHEESLGIRRELGDKQGIAASLNNLGNVSYYQGDYAAAHLLHKESLAIRRELGDKQGIANALNDLGVMARYQGDYAAARSFYEESLAIRRELGDRQAIAALLNNLGNLTHDQGDYAAARSLYEESLAIKRGLGNRQGIAYSLNNLGDLAYKQGDYAAARSLYKEGLEIVRELGDRQEIATSIEAFAGLAAAQGEPGRALRLTGAAAALREVISVPLSSADQSRMERWLEPARQALSEEARAAAWAEGRTMTQEQAIAYALREPL
ncbi:MAG: hypothetical protein A3F84_18045 [Candidatus Handelsmanbacteria bacterium RIFCSPLOWO2_12_FULL_64_10]|uniref:Guanylate cyclase domain-containing protein n=1 Tax=Handelsmanbacteria sp. (strain RIFCSPLOWO2_12_FULL_64_10) TaxID=1817868 RepID=A0A1F6CC58_HANXR|nr:MAG: hypothetical protein A3F84_18045 [Candidatus Handelsmanbacteria bacterium RIFCSPLOWO2_12_FULL_64_10]